MHIFLSSLVINGLFFNASICTTDARCNLHYVLTCLDVHVSYLSNITVITTYLIVLCIELIKCYEYKCCTHGYSILSWVSFQYDINVCFHYVNSIKCVNNIWLLLIRMFQKVFFFKVTFIYDVIHILRKPKHIMLQPLPTVRCD